MKFEQRSFSANIFRPRPEVREESADQLLLIATPWGPREPATSTLDTMADYLLAAGRDPDATTPFPHIEGLSENANNLRIAVLLAHDSLLNKTNKEELLCGVEVFAAIATETEIVWVQCGYPQVLLLRESKPAFPILADLDLSITMSPTDVNLPPLPERFIGIDRDPPVHINSVKRLPGDGLALICRSHIPSTLFDVIGDGVNLDVIAKHCVDQNPNMPFWTGIWHP